MKNVGIVRRLDELGRIVIPREFRKLHRINVGDPLEIVATESGSIIISKVDQVSDMLQLCETVCNLLSGELNATIAASTFEKFLTAAGQGKQAFLEKNLPSATIKLLKNRGFYNGAINAGDDIAKLDDTGFSYVCVVPIFSFYDCFGGLFAFSNSPISNLDAASIKLAGRLVGDTLQKY